jgi:hypothetical protein
VAETIDFAAIVALLLRVILALPLPLSLLEVTAAVSDIGYNRRSAVGDRRYSIASVAIAETVRRLLCV